MKTFNKPLVLFTVLILSANGSSAQVSRAEVKQQLKAALSNGQLAALTGEDSGSTYLSSQFHSIEPRADVKARINQARADGTLNILNGSDSGSFYLARQQRLNTSRADVKAELAAAEKDGTLNRFYREDSGSFDLTAGRTRTSPQPGLASK
ncbi:hypothetical protein [Variovorax saccharolyticus]|uniref:hypothetical protein n=1 Tax=Variovorax saccharolyticus TaxID=3053516 RepID=UPI002577A118|nr:MULTISPECIES: hypothetical protein [unclassified Variovorax]MDM0022306.1 hypothetical protein [Variovorax sp. J22R187]MDM0028862.1 hypothetical protein [Variovorax sp. J31P216]